MDLKKKVILVSGSSSGIGKEVALILADKGAYVIITYNQNKKGGKEVFDICSKKTKCILLNLDTTKEKIISKAVHKIKRKFGKIERIKPLDSDIVVYHRAIGRQEQIKVGHHPETYTFYEYCKNKGIKNLEFYAGFPKHSTEKILALLELGFGSKKPIDIEGVKIKPVNFVTEVLKRVKMPKGYTETENLWVLIKGKHNGKNRHILMECVIPPLKGWEDAGCNIDTGMPASIMAQMIYEGIINQPGSYSPEEIVPVEPFFHELRKRKMLVYENGEVIN